MQSKKIHKLSGVAIAMAAATLVAGCQGYGGTKSDSSMSAASAKTDLAHCYGANVCGGHNDCKGANNACAGKASCKGQGFVAMPAQALLPPSRSRHRNDAPWQRT